MPTKIELTLEQSQQGVSNDVLAVWLDISPGAKAILQDTFYQLIFKLKSSFGLFEPIACCICSILVALDMEDDVDINALTMEQYIALIPGDIKPGIVNPKIGDDVKLEINENFMRELRRKLFTGTDDDDTYEHVPTVLEIVDLFHFPGVTHDAIMLRVFPIKLKGQALRWKNRLPAGTITTWDLLKKEFI
ncbi:hypothetical protein Tco_0527308 [Tanacetum coccineum]